ncbi:hypothetical protein FGG08_000310 [Glutinoglossum americanum]|uniref:Iron-sulfur cluster assembly factor IBA57 homolog, mitochondrial n=1 Tax=Glutinoglossum americanum TaxID=1670608 RepID=A0A9P8IFS4_9PEZI|nr:hypothetical protein FGG08_000310 [Glutinoglossum americanum]
MFSTRPCTQSLKRQCLSKRSYTSKLIHPPYPPPSGTAKLTNRSLIALHGEDVPRFLQGMITNKVRPTEKGGFFAAFLNAKGRVLNDVFIYPATHSPNLPFLPTSPATPTYLIESSAISITPLLTHIHRHKLRTKFTATLLPPSLYSIYQTWSPPNLQPYSPPSHQAEEISCIDPRAPGMGRRTVIFHNKDAGEGEGLKETATLEDYTLHRLFHGVPEGQTEILPGIALPHESNLDLMSAIDFQKGCYLGQELTIRTHHTGVVRKRILPMNLYHPTSPPPQTLSYNPDTAFVLPAPETSISRLEEQTEEGGVASRNSHVGKFLGGVGDLGVGLWRLEGVGGGEFEVGKGGALRCRAFVPEWHKNRGKMGAKGS